jgi:hypothetical protein
MRTYIPQLIALTGIYITVVAASALPLTANAAATGATRYSGETDLNPPVSPAYQAAHGDVGHLTRPHRSSLFVQGEVDSSPVPIAAAPRGVSKTPTRALRAINFVVCTITSEFHFIL